MTLGLLVLAAGEVAAVPINIVATRRVEIRAGSAPVFADLWSTTGPYGASFSHPAAVPGGGLVSVSAAQATLVDGASGVFSGTGSASIGYSVLASQQIYATSFFDVMFDLVTAHGYSLAGALTANDDGGFARARVSLTGPVSWSFLAIGMDPNTALSGSGVLQAGTYHLVVEAAMDNGGNVQQGAYMGGASDFDFQFRVTSTGTPVPEPATMLLVGVGLAACGARLTRGARERLRRPTPAYKREQLTSAPRSFSHLLMILRLSNVVC